MRLVAALLLPLLAFANDDKNKQPQTLELSVKQAVAMALNNNLDIEVARFDPWIQERTLLASFGAFDTVVFATNNYTDSNQQTASALAGADILKREINDASLGVRKKFPFGASTEVKFSSQRSKTNSAFALLDPAWTDSVGITLTVPVLKGAGYDYNYGDIQINQARRDSSLHTFEKHLSESVFATLKAYDELVFAAENRKVAMESLQLAKRLLDENIKKYKAELLPKLEVTQAEVQVTIEEQNVIVAEQVWRNAMDRLKRLIDPKALAAKEEVLIVPSEMPSDPRSDVDEKALVEQMLGEALKNRADYLALKKDLEAQDHLIAKARNETLPKFDLVGTATYSGVDDSFGRSFHEMGTLDSRDYVVGFSFELPLENTSASNLLRRYELERRKMESNLRNFESGLILEIREAVREIKTQERKIRSARDQVRLARERLEAEQAKQAQQLQTYYFVLEAQREVTRARVNEIRALVDYNVAWHLLRKSTGSLLREFNVSVPRELTRRQQ